MYNVLYYVIGVFYLYQTTLTSHRYSIVKMLYGITRLEEFIVYLHYIAHKGRPT